MGMLSSCICSTLVSACAMEGFPIGPLAQWGKDLTYYLTPFFCLVNWDMYYPGSACRGTDLTEGLENELWHRWSDGITYGTAHSPTLPSPYLRHSSIYPSVTSPTSQLILQPFLRFSYVTGSSHKSPGEPPMLWSFSNSLLSKTSRCTITFTFQLLSRSCH